MSTRNSVSGMSLAALQALAQQQLERTPIANISLWPNTKRRADKNDAQFTGKLQISNVRVLEDIRTKLSPEGQAALDTVTAELMAKSLLVSDAFADVWQNEPSVGKTGGDRPILSGRSRNFVEARAAAGDAQSESIVAKLAAAAGK